MYSPFEGRNRSDHQDTVFCVAFNKRSARIAIARTGKGTRLSTSINIRGDMLYLLLSCVSMPSWVAMPGPEKYPKRRGLEVPNPMHVSVAMRSGKAMQRILTTFRQRNERKIPACGR